MNTVSSGVHYRQSCAWAVCAFWLIAWVITACVTTVAKVSAAGITENQSRFQRTIEYLQEASPELRSEFAAIALTNMVQAYQVEAELARADAKATGQDANLRSWSNALDQYARQVPPLLQDIELGLPVRLMLSTDQSLAIAVADRVVILSHPRLMQQNAFEQAVLADFCAGHRCEQFTPGSADAEPITVSTAQVSPDWTFSAQGPVCSHQGLQIRFNSEQNLANSRLICEQFLQEVVSLSDEMARQQRQAVLIDWHELDIQPTPHRPEHVVRLNATGDSVLLTVPVLYSSPGLLGHVLPWMRARLDNSPEVVIEVQSERYGWEKPLKAVSP